MRETLQKSNMFCSIFSTDKKRIDAKSLPTTLGYSKLIAFFLLLGLMFTTNSIGQTIMELKLNNNLTVTNENAVGTPSATNTGLSYSTTACEGTHSLIANNNGEYLQINVNTTGYTSIVVTIKQNRSGGSGVWQLSGNSNADANFGDYPATTFPNMSTSCGISSLILNAGFNNNGGLNGIGNNVMQLRITSSGIGTNTLTLDDIYISGTTPTVTVTPVTAYTYNGTAQGPTVATNTGTGTTYTWSYAGTGGTIYTASATRPTDVGNYTATATVAANGNFIAASSSAYTFTIGTATPTVTVTPIGTYTYSGSAQGPIAATNTGTGTTYTWSYAGTGGTIYSASATRPTNAGNYTATATVAANGNYSTASSTATAFTIGAKALTAATTIANKVYNGSAVTGAVTTGAITGEVVAGDVTIATAISSNFADANVGTAKPTTVTYTLANGTGLASNYSIAPLATSGNITGKVLTITADNASKNINNFYNLGTTAFTHSTGLISGESIQNVTLTSAGASAGAAAGTYPIVPSAPTGTNFIPSNYTITYANGTLTVNPAVVVSVTVTASATTVCQGTAVIFSAAINNGGTTPVYQWYNGATPVGTNSSTYTYTPTVGNTDAITVKLTSNDPAPGLIGNPATSSPAITVAVSPTVVTPTVTLAAGVLTSSAATGNQWWNCTTNTAIAGATNKTYTPALAGSYKVVVTGGACSATSSCVVVTNPLAVNGFDSKAFSFYPNPINNELNLSYSKDITSVKVINLLGQVMSSQSVNATTVTINTSSLAPGTYLVEVKSADESKTIKVVKK